MPVFACVSFPFLPFYMAITPQSLAQISKGEKGGKTVAERKKKEVPKVQKRKEDACMPLPESGCKNIFLNKVV